MPTPTMSSRFDSAKMKKPADERRRENTVLDAVLEAERDAPAEVAEHEQRWLDIQRVYGERVYADDIVAVAPGHLLVEPVGAPKSIGAIITHVAADAIPGISHIVYRVLAKGASTRHYAEGGLLEVARVEVGWLVAVNNAALVPLDAKQQTLVIEERHVLAVFNPLPPPRPEDDEG